jgi:hypothetical protein
MRKRIVFAAFLLSTCGVFGENGVGQEAKKPFTKPEIIRLLNPMPGTSYEQGDLAAEIARRGVAFPLDEMTLDELRKAGARWFVIDAIQKAAQNAASKQTPPQPQTQEQPQSRNRPAAEAPTADARPHLQSQSSPDDPATTAKEATRDAPKIDVTKLPLLDQARYHAAEFMNDLPNFVVTQIVTRSVRTPGKKDWRRQDKLEIELSYRAKTGEQFKLVRYNDKPTQMTYDQLKGRIQRGPARNFALASNGNLQLQGEEGIFQRHDHRRKQRAYRHHGLFGERLDRYGKRTRVANQTIRGRHPARILDHIGGARRRI